VINEAEMSGCKSLIICVLTSLVLNCAGERERAKPWRVATLVPREKLSCLNRKELLAFVRHVSTPVSLSITFGRKTVLKPKRFTSQLGDNRQLVGGEIWL
jgi:hypothetical protein